MIIQTRPPPAGVNSGDAVSADGSSGAASRLACRLDFGHDVGMERVVHKANGFKEAEEWDIQQQVAMTPEQRLRAAKELRDRVYPADSKDIRAWHNKQ